VAPQREWFEKDYYEVLGVSQDASAKDVTRAYRKLAKQYHPDANPGDAAAEEKFKEISAANDVLGDAEKRKEYDEVRRMVASGMGPGNFGGPGGPGGPGGGFPGGGNVRFEDLGDLGHLRQLVRRWWRRWRWRTPGSARWTGRAPARSRHRDRAPP